MKSLAVLVALFGLAGCGGDDEFDPAKRYPATGNTKTFDLSVEDVAWEVGPGAIYNAWTYNGSIPGPTLDVTAGDKVVVRLTNNTNHPASIHTHIVEFEQTADGADESSIAMPGQTVTVEWNAVFAGSFPYHDHASEAEGVARGLIGALVVRPPDEAKANEQLVVLTDFEPRHFKQLPGVADPVTGEIPTEGEFRGAHQYLHTINGKAYEESVTPFTGKVGELTRWRVISIGEETHTWHVHGHRWTTRDGELTDNIILAPGMYNTFEFMEDKAGDWLVHCHFPEHIEGGMMARYRVVP